MNDSRILVARLGQIQITDDGATLKAIMGSCVGIGILWRKRGIYALSHCLLATSPAANEQWNAKYVSDAVPMMLDAMQAESRRDRRSLEAVVVGGGTLLQETGKPGGGGGEIGPSNLKAAKKYLDENRVAIRHLQSAAENASQLFIDGTTGDYNVVLIPKLIIEKQKKRRPRSENAILRSQKRTVRIT